MHPFVLQYKPVLLLHMLQMSIFLLVHLVVIPLLVSYLSYSIREMITFMSRTVPLALARNVNIITLGIYSCHPVDAGILKGVLVSYLIVGIGDIKSHRDYACSRYLAAP